MVSRLKPLELTIEFAEGIHRLGKTIEVTVKLDPKRDVEVREGRVELVCQEKWTESTMVKKYTPRSVRRGRAGGIVLPPQGPTIEELEVTKQSRTSVPSSFTFIQEGQIVGGRPKTYSGKLEVPSEVQRRGSDGSIKWTVVATVDVVRGRDVKTQRAVKIGLPGD